MDLIRQTGTFCVLCLFAFPLSTCGKKLDCREVKYSFELPIKAYPDSEIINIGDTIWLEIDEPTKLYDANSMREVNYGGANNLGTDITIGELISVNKANVDAINFFTIKVLNGKEFPRTISLQSKEYLFEETSGRYQFKLALIPTKAGVFKLFAGSASGVTRVSDKCTKAVFSINFKSTNQHYNLNEVSFPGITNLGVSGVYLFKVQ